MLGECAGDVLQGQRHAQLLSTVAYAMSRPLGKGQNDKKGKGQNEEGTSHHFVNLPFVQGP